MNTKLQPIENPSLAMRLVYYFSKKKFGKVLTPLKVAYSRLPLAFGRHTGQIGELDKKLKLRYDLALLIRHHVAQINNCTFCMDIGISIAIQGKNYSDKFYHMDEIKTNPLYSEADRAAIAFADELTRLKKVSDSTFSELKKYFSEREIVEMAWLVATEHYYNMVNVAFDIESDGLCDIRRKY